MKNLLLIGMLLSTGTALANDYQEICKNRYRDATLALIDSARALNQNAIGSVEFLANFSMIESEIGAKRLICSFEDPSIRECVRLYKKQYHKVRANVDVVAIAQGEQNRVSVGLVEASMLVTDLRCQ